MLLRLSFPHLSIPLPPRSKHHPRLHDVHGRGNPRRETPSQPGARARNSARLEKTTRTPGRRATIVSPSSSRRRMPSSPRARPHEFEDGELDGREG